MQGTGGMVQVGPQPALTIVTGEEAVETFPQCTTPGSEGVRMLED